MHIKLLTRKKGNTYSMLRELKLKLAVCRCCRCVLLPFCRLGVGVVAAFTDISPTLIGIRYNGFHSFIPSRHPNLGWHLTAFNI